MNPSDRFTSKSKGKNNKNEYEKEEELISPEKKREIENFLEKCSIINNVCRYGEDFIKFKTDLP